MKTWFTISFIGLFLTLPIVCSSQNLIWETIITDSVEFERLNDIESYGNGDLIAVGINVDDSTTNSIIIKLDSNGNEIWKKDFAIDTGNRTWLTNIIRVGDKDEFYFTGAIQQDNQWSFDLIGKIDSVGDTIWTRRYTYPTFYGTTTGLVKLRDESIVSVGSQQTVNGFDITARRLDSLGNWMWEYTYGIPNNQSGDDITELMDGSLLITGGTDVGNHVMRIDFDGNLIDYYEYNNSSPVIASSLMLIPDNNALVMSATGSFSSSFKNLNVFQDTSFTKLQTLPINLIDGIVDRDSNAVLIYFDGDSMQFRYTKVYSLNNIWDISLGQVNSDYLRPNKLLNISGPYFIAVGWSINTAGEEYWIAKYDGIGEPWEPDYCGFSPPEAGFEFNFNDPLLTLKDTSYSGLQYLDSIFNWQWNTSVGNFNLGDSISLFIDTTITKTIDVELIVSNWYGCTDTVQRTLNFGPNGIREIKNERLKIYPNPARNLVNFELSNANDQNYTLSIYDLKGVLIEEVQLNETNVQYDVSQLKSGMYIYKVNAASGPVRGKLVVE